ncbi:MAG TPA: HypC/HybG/HupF family hydrogenase formation chaperone [Thermoplasmata archaeon]|nr:HypC/HybG/HupF family hydrogenase formation chaperone [Thermoplasmata archaeon]
MCLAVPGQILRIIEETPEARIVEVDFAGVRKSVNLVFLPEATVGNYVVVHAGFATTLIPEAEALEAQAHFRRIQRLTASADAGSSAPARPTPAGTRTVLNP